MVGYSMIEMKMTNEKLAMAEEGYDET